jgi:uncharacterized protein
VEQVRARARRDQQRLDAGAVGSARDLQSLQREIESLARRQAELEDVELEIMERLEECQNRAAALREEQVSAQAQLADVTARRDTATAEIDQEVETLSAARAGLAGELPGELLALYDKLRAQFDGVGAAALRARRCEGCRLELNTVELARISAAAPEEVLRCEECRRILVRTPESGL